MWDFQTLFLLKDPHTMVNNDKPIIFLELTLNKTKVWLSELN